MEPVLAAFHHAKAGVMCRGEGFDRRGLVDYGGVRQRVSLAFLPDAAPGDYLLVHVGYAMTRLDPSAAEKLLRDIAPDSPATA